MSTTHQEEFQAHDIESKVIMNENKEQVRPNLERGETKHEVTGTKFILILVGLVLSIFVAALDNTIISTALTTITSELNALDEVTWVASSYLLTSTALQPLYGKFSDIFGRKVTMLFALSIFLVGSVVCGASQNIIMLIVFRAIAGIGGGGLISLSVIIISDIVPLEKRGMYMGMVGANFAVASVVGPLLGGVLTQEVSWRWAFYINIPICLVAIAVIFFFLRLPSSTEKFSEKLKRIDYLGTITLVMFITLFVLALNWGGKDYPWDSAAVIATLIVGILCLIGFVVVEMKVAREPILPPHILTRNVISANLTAFFNGAVFFSAVIYLPIYYQIVHQRTAIMAGLELLPLLLGVVVCSMGSGIFMSKVGIYRPLTWSGTTIALIGTTLFGTLMRPDISRPEEIIFSLLLGLGIGLCIQTNTIATQAAVEMKDIAVATSLVSFSQSMGGVIGLAVLGTVFQNKLLAYLTANLPADTNVAEITRHLNTGNGSIDTTLMRIVQDGYVEAIKYIFLVGIAFIAISLISGAFLKHIPLRRPGVKPGNNKEMTALPAVH